MAELTDEAAAISRGLQLRKGRWLVQGHVEAGERRVGHR